MAGSPEVTPWFSEAACLEGIAGVLFSPARGLLVYTRIVLFALAAFSPRAKQARTSHSSTVLFAGTFTILHLLLTGLWPVWWGGHSWGPRLLTEIISPAVVLVAVGLPALNTTGYRRTFASAALYCVMMQAVGVYFYPKGRWDDHPVSVDRQPSRVWDWLIIPSCDRFEDVWFGNRTPC